MAKSEIPYRGEIDWVNEKVAAATGLSLKFLYQGDGVHPSTKSLQMNLDAFTKLQRENDVTPARYTVTCGTCRQGIEREPVRQSFSISQKMAMSEAWSHELRYKIQESERKNKTPQVCVDPYFEDWE